MPYRLVRGRRLVPGDPRHGTRWATPAEKALAAQALQELQTHRNVIALAPAPEPHFDGHKVRVQEQTNPLWYRLFGLPYWRSARSSQLKRVRVERALKRVSVVGIVRRNGYETKLLPFLSEELEKRHGELQGA